MPDWSGLGPLVEIGYPSTWRSPIPCRRLPRRRSRSCQCRLCHRSLPELEAGSLDAPPFCTIKPAGIRC